MPHIVVSDLLSAEDAINATVCLLVSVHLLCVAPIGEFDNSEFAKMASASADLSASLQATKNILNKLPPALCEAPLQRSVPFLQAWTDTAMEFNEQVKASIIASACRFLATQSNVVDGLSPRWGEAVNDSEVQDDAAKVALIMDSRLVSLPAECRKLHSALGMMASVASLLNLPGGVESHPETKEIVRSARNAMSFGKRTVNVSAGVRLLFTTPVNKKGIESMLEFKDTLPEALVQRLAAKLDPIGGTSKFLPAASSKTSGASSGSGMKRTRSWTAIESSGPGVKKQKE